MNPIRPRKIECFINNRLRQIELKSFCGLIVKHCKNQSIALSNMGANQLKEIKKVLANKYGRKLQTIPELGRIYLTI